MNNYILELLKLNAWSLEFVNCNIEDNLFKHVSLLQKGLLDIRIL